MTTEQQYILQILAAALRGEACAAEPSAALSRETLFAEAGEQGVSAMLYFGMDKTVLPEALAARWEASAFREAASALRVTDAHRKVCSLLEENGVPIVVLKGYASACYYAHPEYRSMGDVDFYVEEPYQAKARALLLANGFEEVDRKRHHDWLYRKSGISYELHFAISGVPHGKEGEPFREALQGIVSDRQWVQSKMGRIAIPSDFHHGLILLLHTASHLMAGGLGLRHLCDWAAFVNHFDDVQFRQLFQDKFEELRIWRFAQVLTAVCERYLDLRSHDWVVDFDESSLEKLMEEFLKSGDYSANHVSRQSDLMTSEGFSIRIGHKSGIGNLIAVLRNSVEYHWPKTQKNKVLLVFGMMYSAIRYFIRVIMGKRAKLNLIEMSKEAGERRKLFREFGLIDGSGE